MRMTWRKHRKSKKIENFFFDFFFKKKWSEIFFPIFFQIHKIYHLGLLCTNFQCSGIIFYFFQIWPTDKKVQSFFLWWDTKNLKILDESLWSLVFKITWTKFSNSCIVRFSVRFSKNVAKTWPDEPENLNLKILFTWF